MKVTVFVCAGVLISAQLLFAAPALSQNYEKTVISLDYANVHYKRIFHAIEKKANVVIMFEYTKAFERKRVSISVRNKTVADVLDQLLSPEHIKWAIRRNIIRLYREKEKDTARPASLQSSLPAVFKLPPGKEITGHITDSVTGQPLQGVAVRVKGTTLGTVTDARGYFSLTVSDGAKLLVSFLGYNPKETQVDGNNVINISLVATTTGLNQLVVVGYGTQRKEDVTSAITHLSAKDFTKGVVRSPLQLLAGKAAGVSFAYPSGDPTSEPQINIRGIATIASSSNPLIVIDGIPGGSLNSIAPEDIQTIDVLKSSAAAAIYGTRANGGVIIITTKSKESGRKVEYDFSLNLDQVENKIDVLSADQYRHLPQITGLSDLHVNDRGSNTNWQDEILRQPLNQVHHLAIYGGNGKSNYTASMEYRTQDGTMLNSDKNSLIARLGIHHSALDDRLRINIDLSDNYTTDKGVWYNAYLASVTKNPTDSVYFPNGMFNDYPSEPLNPVAQLTTETSQRRWNQLRASGKITIEPVKNWNISVLGALQRYDNETAKSNDFRSQSTTLLHLNSQVWLDGSQSWNQTLEVTSDYTRSFGLHNFMLLGGYTYQLFNDQGYDMYAYNFPTDQFGPWNIGLSKSIAEGQSTMNSYRSKSQLTAFFGRINYNYNHKYILMGSLRREGSSKFGVNHKWGWFPAISAGWRISQEPFMKEVSFISDLKLRAGYGVTGTQPSNSYLSLALLNYTNRVYYNGDWIRGVQPASNYNPNLRWEKKGELDIGLDFSLFRNKLNGSFDYYNNLTKDLLYLYNVPVPPNLFNQTWANVGNIRNKGIEIMLNSDVINSKKLNWTIGGTFSYNTNRLLKFSNDIYKLDFLNAGSAGSPIQTFTHRVKEGQPIGNFFGFQSVRLDSTGNWLIKTPEGKIVPISQAGDGDKQVIGNGIPKMYASIYTTLTYKNFDFSLTLRGAFEYQILNQYRMHFENMSEIGAYNSPTSVLTKPYGGDEYILGPPQYVSYFIENGDYVKISNAAIGYTIPLHTKIFNGLRVYVSGLNLYTFTAYQGLDPEVSIKGLDPGTDYWEKYPSIRTYTFGVNVSF